MKKIFLFILIVLASPLITSADVFDSSLWKYVAPLRVSTVSEEGFGAVYLGKDILKHVNADINPEGNLNMRIVTEDGSEVPYVGSNTGTRSNTLNVALSDISKQGNKAIAIGDLGESVTSHDGLGINTSSKNFKAKVSVFASDRELPVTSSEWRLLTGEGYIYNFSDNISGVDLSGVNITYPKSGARFLKVEVASFEGSEVSINSVNVFKNESVREIPEDTFKAPFLISHDREKGISIIELDFKEGEVIKGFSIPVRDQNFNRRVVAEYETVGGSVRTSSDYIFSVNTEAIKKSKLDVSFPESTLVKKLKITVVNNNDIPLTFEKEIVFTSPRALVYFKAANPGDYSLYVDGSARTPVYDLNNIFPYINEEVPLSEAGSVAPNPTYKEVEVKVPLSERYKSLLSFVLVALVISLGILGTYYIKKVNAK